MLQADEVTAVLLEGELVDARGLRRRQILADHALQQLALGRRVLDDRHALLLCDLLALRARLIALRVLVAALVARLGRLAVLGERLGAGGQLDVLEPVEQLFRRLDAGQVNLLGCGQRLAAWHDLLDDDNARHHTSSGATERHARQLDIGHQLQAGGRAELLCARAALDDFLHCLEGDARTAALAVDLHHERVSAVA